MIHRSVLVDTALEYLAIRPDGVYVDATFGAGGHSGAILERLDRGRLIGVDADPDAVARSQRLADPRFSFVLGNFRDLGVLLDRCGAALVDGVLFDLGVSSMQLEDAQRGFSFAKPAPLDMRMNQHAGRSAYQILATATENELADIFYYYGEERAARRIARAVVQRRAGVGLPNTTAEFAQLVAGVVARPGHRERIHPATRAFQALRIAANDELDSLRDGLESAVTRLREAGRVVAISFHSLEDRIVKRAFRDDARLTVLTKRPIRPSGSEVDENRRARSAKLRAAQRKAS